MDLNEARGILLAADIAATEAVQANKHLENPNAFDCGFAWVVIENGRSQIVKAAKAAKPHQPGYGHMSHKRGYHVWMPGRGGFGGQSIAVFEAGAQAFADVLKAKGIACHVDSRLD